MSDIKEEINTEHIVDDFNFQKDVLEKQITILELRQQEIQSHIASIENANHHLDILIQQEKDSKKKGFLFKAKTSNIEILVKLYDTYNRFEETKFKYYNNIGDLTFKQHRMIEVDIKKISEKVDKLTGNDMVDMFKNLSDLFSNTSSMELSPEIKNQINVEDDDYKL